jgi:hypothetical protein
MNLSDSVVLKLRDVFTQVEMDGSLEECLTELSALVAHVLSAKGCTILLLSEEEAEEAGCRDRAGFGTLPGHIERLRNAGPGAGVARDKPLTAMVRGSHGDMESMFSTIVLNGKVIGVMHASRPQQHSCFSKDDLDLFSILTPIITKSIQVIQLQHILKSRFTQIALTRSSEKTMHELISGVMQNPNQLSRILAKSFYREMLRAGFNFNQILYAATEVISELSISLRKHSAGRRQRFNEDGPALEQLFETAGNRPAALPPPARDGVANHISA